MILERISSLKLEEIEGALRRCARRRRAGISPIESTGPSMVYAVLQPDLYERLLDADMRFAALLPCRIAVYTQNGNVHLVATSPADFSRSINRPELAGLAGAADALLNELLDEVSRPAAMAATTAGGQLSALGATEDQVNMRAALPQRIDNRGSKLEEIAGTGQHDSQGG